VRGKNNISREADFSLLAIRKIREICQNSHKQSAYPLNSRSFSLKQNKLFAYLLFVVWPISTIIFSAANYFSSYSKPPIQRIHFSFSAFICLNTFDESSLICCEIFLFIGYC
jgi:hypothetical protein